MVFNKIYKIMGAYLDNYFNKQSISEEAQSILKSDSFKIAKELLQNDLMVDWLMTKPDEIQKREDIYRRFQNVNLLAARLDWLVAQHEQEELLKKAQEHSEENKNDRRNPTNDSIWK